MKKTIKILFVTIIAYASILPQASAIDETRTVGAAGADYATLKLAFDAINAGNLTGNITLQIIDNTIESASAVLNAGSVLPANYTSVTIYSTAIGLSINGNLAAPLVDLNGATNITFDGRVNQSGEKSLEIINTSTLNTAGTSTFRFRNGASDNTIRYCIIKGATMHTSGGMIVFSTSTASAGNSNNTIEYNDITGVSAANRPYNTIYSAGTAGKDNIGVTILNNMIYDFLSSSAHSNGIFLASNSTAWTISNNSFFETTPLSPNSNYSYIVIRINTSSGNDYVISGNHIGGSGPLCSGTWIKSGSDNNQFRAFNLSLGSGSNTIQNNVIRNFNWSNNGNAGWQGIYFSDGSANIEGNYIGDTVSNGSLTISSSGGSSIHGIWIRGYGQVACNGNTIGSITGIGTAESGVLIYGIYTEHFGTTSSISITNNIIGSPDVAQSICASAASTSTTQDIFGINSKGSSNPKLIDNNLIANMANASQHESTGAVTGIFFRDGTNTVTNNVIRDLSNTNNTAWNIDGTVVGINVNSNTVSNILSGNTIYNLTNSNPSFSGNLTGIYFSGSGSNTVNQNFIHSLNLHSSSTGAEVFGFRIFGSASLANNIVLLGGAADSRISGIFVHGGTSSNAIHLYHNTVHISGNPGASAVNETYALYSNYPQATQNFRNNIFSNQRINDERSGQNYAAYFWYTSAPNLTLDYNNYYVNESWGIPGYFNSQPVYDLPLVPEKDANSMMVDPLFENPDGLAAEDFKSNAALFGVMGTGVTTDFGQNPRTEYPIMGAWEKIFYFWKGAISSNWNTPGNWTANEVPHTEADIFFAASPQNHCLLDQDRIVMDINNAQSTYGLILNGHKLTVKGNLNLSNGAYIDASFAGSEIEFAGEKADEFQIIPPNAFLNNEVYNLTLNTEHYIQFHGTIRLLNTFTVLQAGLNANTNSPTFVYAGTQPQTIFCHQFLNNTFFNLTIDNPAGVNIQENCNITVRGLLQVNPDAIFRVKDVLLKP